MIALAGGDVSANDAQALRIFLATVPTIGFEPHFTCSWVEFNDIDAGTNSVDLRSTLGSLDNSGIQTLVEAPAPGRQRQVKWISVLNFDSLTHSVQIFLDTTALDRLLCWVQLGPGEQLHYIDTRGFYIITASGAEKVVSGTTQFSTRILLSGSAFAGRPIAVAATASPGTLIHTVAGSIGAPLDEVWLWASNHTGAAATLTLEWAGTAVSDHIIGAFSVPANSSPILVAQGLMVRLAGTVIRAFSGTASAINIFGYANRLE